jgi:hypothetical protein
MVVSGPGQSDAARFDIVVAGVQVPSGPPIQIDIQFGCDIIKTSKRAALSHSRLTKAISPKLVAFGLTQG